MRKREEERDEQNKKQKPVGTIRTTLKMSTTEENGKLTRVTSVMPKGRPRFENSRVITRKITTPSLNLERDILKKKRLNKYKNNEIPNHFYCYCKYVIYKSNKTLSKTNNKHDIRIMNTIQRINLKTRFYMVASFLHSVPGNNTAKHE